MRGWIAARGAVFVAVVVTVVGLGGAANAATGPALASLSLSASAVDISAFDRTVTATARITDTTGFNFGCLDVDAPDTPAGEYFERICFTAAARTSGTTLNGLYAIPMTFPQYSHTGDYKLRFNLVSTGGAITTITNTDLVQRALPSKVNVFGNADTVLPVLSSLSLSPTTIDVGPGIVDVTLQASVTDDKAGFGAACLDLGSPAAPTTLFKSLCIVDPANRSSGTKNNGTYLNALRFDNTFATGVYPVLGLSYTDRAFNDATLTPAQLAARGIATSITVTNTGPVVPAAPTNVTLFGEIRGVTVGWTVPTDGGSTITGYTLTDHVTGLQYEVAGANTSLYTLAAAPLSSHRFSVHANNAVGAGAESTQTATVTVEVAVPLAPTQVTAAAQANGKVSIDWTAPTDTGGIPITHYRVENAELLESMNVSGTKTHADYEGLVRGRTYTFRVRASNEEGEGGPSALSAPVELTTSVPNKPTGLTASASSKTVNLSWTPPADDGGSPITGYYISTDDDPSIGRNVPAGQTSLTITELTNGKKYTFSVRTKNVYGTSPPGYAPGVTPKPVIPIPAGVYAEPMDGAAWVHWNTGCCGGGVTNYIVTAHPSERSVTLDSTTFNTFFPGLTNGQGYTFTVRVKNGLGEGEESNPSQPVIPFAPTGNVPSAPLAPFVFAQDSSALVTWAEPNANGSPITAYKLTVSPGGTSVLRSGAAPYVFEGLTNGVAYTFTVAAINGSGTGPESPPSNVVTPRAAPVPPSPPTNVVATAANGSAQVSWSAPSNDGGLPPWKYTVTAEPGGVTTWVVTDFVNPTPTTALVTGLTNGVAYTFTVVAENGAGASDPSSPSNSVTPDPGVVENGLPLVVMLAPGAAVSMTRSISIKWGGSDISGIHHYEVRRRYAPWNGALRNWEVYKPSTTATSAGDLGNYGRTYCYGMRAQDGVGNMSNWTTKKCTVIPLNSDQLGYSSGWYRSANAGEFAGFGHVTKTKGAKMTRTGIVAKKVSLVVTKCTWCGTVEVRWNGKVVKTVSLVASKTVHKQVVDVASFATAQTGTLTVTNTAPNGKSVVLEGVAVFNG